MAELISKLKQKLTKFKSWIEGPRLYVSCELDDIKNEIDIVVESLLLDEAHRSDEGMKASDIQKRINANRKLMINLVDAYEKRVFNSLTSNELEAKFAKKLNSSVQKHEDKFHELESTLALLAQNEIQNEIARLEHAIDVTIYEFDCKIKQNKSILYLNPKEMSYKVDFFANSWFKSTYYPTGILLVLDDCITKENFK